MKVISRFLLLLAVAPLLTLANVSSSSNSRVLKKKNKSNKRPKAPKAKVPKGTASGKGKGSAKMTSVPSTVPSTVPSIGDPCKATFVDGICSGVLSNVCPTGGSCDRELGGCCSALGADYATISVTCAAGNNYIKDNCPQSGPV